MERPITVICDIDGLIFPQTNGEFAYNSKILPGVKAQFEEWGRQGSYIILITGRRESCRKQTEDQLFRNNIFHDVLVMGVGIGKRVLINDQGSNGEIKAFAFSPPRDEGLVNFSLNKIKGAE